MAQAGITHAGFNGDALPSTQKFLSMGKIKAQSRSVLMIKGISVTLRQIFFDVVGVSYSASLFGFFAVNSTMTFNLLRTVKVLGARRFPSEHCFLIKGFSVNVKNLYLQSKGFVVATLYTAFNCASSIKGYSKRFFGVMGDIHGMSRSYYKLRARLRSLCLTICSAKGNIGLGVKHNVKCIACSVGILKYIVTNKGFLKSSKVTVRIVIKGLISSVAYVCSVPKRIQEFITNKRWFRQ